MVFQSLPVVFLKVPKQDGDFHGGERSEQRRTNYLMLKAPLMSGKSIESVPLSSSYSAKVCLGKYKA